MTVPADPAPSRPPASATHPLVRQTLIVAGVLAVLALAWMLRHVLLLGFGAVLVAVLLTSCGGWLEHWFKLGPKAGVIVSLVVLVMLGGLLVWLAGSRVAGEAATIRTQLPAGLADLEARLAGLGLSSDLDKQLADAVPGVASIGSFAAGLIGALVDGLVVLFVGVYLAMGPAQYRDGMLLLVPATQRARGREALNETGQALRRWLRAQLTAMAAVALLTSLGLWAAGTPAALALGLLAGLTNIIPFFGPIIAGVPSVLVALTAGPDVALYTLLVFAVIQQVEGNMITPLLEKRAVKIPPALTLIALLAMSALFGPLGMVLGAPLTVCLFVLVAKLYVETGLHTPVQLREDEARAPTILVDHPGG